MTIQSMNSLMMNALNQNLKTKVVLKLKTRHLGWHAMCFVRIRSFFVRHVFVFKTAVCELYFVKNFVRVTIIKFSSYSCCFAKPKIFVFMFVKKLEQQNFRVLKKMCTDKKVFVFVVQHKRKIFVKKAEMFVFKIFLYLHN